MEGVPSCKIHDKPLKLYCPATKKFLCDHCKKPAENEPMDIFTYATLIPNKSVEDLREQIPETTLSLKSFSDSLPKLKDRLQLAKEKLSILMDWFDTAMTVVNKGVNGSEYDPENVLARLEARQRDLGFAIANKDMVEIIRLIADIECSEVKRVDEIHSGISQLLRPDAIPALMNSLEKMYWKYSTLHHKKYEIPFDEQTTEISKVDDVKLTTYDVVKLTDYDPTFIDYSEEGVVTHKSYHDVGNMKVTDSIRSEAIYDSGVHAFEITVSGGTIYDGFGVVEDGIYHKVGLHDYMIGVFSNHTRNGIVKNAEYYDLKDHSPYMVTLDFNQLKIKVKGGSLAMEGSLQSGKRYYFCLTFFAPISMKIRAISL